MYNNLDTWNTYVIEYIFKYVFKMYLKVKAFKHRVYI